jgi:hypothetical protein
VRLTDFNDILATYDGFFSAEDTALNSPVVGAGGFVGTVSGDAELGGVQIFTALDTEATYLRVFRRNPSDAATIYWGTWEIINAGTAGGGGTGVVASVQAGDHIIVDSTDPVNPIVYTTGLISGLTSADSSVDITDNGDGTLDLSAVGGGGGVTQGAISESGTLSVSAGTKRAYNDTGATRTLLSIRATVDTPPSGGTVVVDVRVNGTSVFTSSPKPTIAAGGYTDIVTAIDLPSVPNGAYVTIDVVSTTFPAADLTVQWSWS